MESSPKKRGEHIFSIQLKSKDHVKTLALPNDAEGNVLIEGFLGNLESLSFTEGIMLEINGANGSLKMDLTKEDLRGLLPRSSSPSPKSEKTENKRLKHEK